MASRRTGEFPPRVTLAFRLLFWAAVAVTLWFALSPAPPTLIDNDKSQHELAFFVLAVLAAAAYPALRWYWQFAALAALGGLIELLQLIPALHRDGDIMDWLADLASIAVAVTVIAVVRRLIRR